MYALKSLVGILIVAGALLAIALGIIALMYVAFVIVGHVSCYLPHVSDAFCIIDRGSGGAW
jgi:hypothetical protein